MTRLTANSLLNTFLARWLESQAIFPSNAGLGASWGAVCATEEPCRKLRPPVLQADHRRPRPNELLDRNKGRWVVPKAGPLLRASGRRSTGRLPFAGLEVPGRLGFGRLS